MFLWWVREAQPMGIAAHGRLKPGCLLVGVAPVALVGVTLECASLNNAGGGCSHAQLVPSAWLDAAPWGLPPMGY